MTLTSTGVTVTNIFVSEIMRGTIDHYSLLLACFFFFFVKTIRTQRSSICFLEKSLFFKMKVCEALHGVSRWTCRRNKTSRFCNGHVLSLTAAPSFVLSSRFSPRFVVISPIWLELNWLLLYSSSRLMRVRQIAFRIVLPIYVADCC